MAYTKLSLSALLIAITFNACGQIDMKTNKKTHQTQIQYKCKMRT